MHPAFEMEPRKLIESEVTQGANRRETVVLNTENLGKGKYNEVCRMGCVKYVCWTIHITILMRITSASNPAVPIDVGSGISATIDPKPPNPIADLFRTRDTISIITNLHRGTFSGEGYSRIEFSWAHIVPCTFPSPHAMGRSDPPFLHAHDTVPALQSNPAGSIGATMLRKARPPKLTRSIEPA
jgi:hypothetical protein